jgi:ribosomal protein S18 acetylase RimI-like enzyme
MGTADGLIIRPYDAKDRDEVVGLWDRSGLIVPWNDPDHDIECKLKVMGELFLVGVIDGKVIATAMVGYEGHRGWINYLAVDAGYRRKGIARALMEKAEEELRKLGCPKINVQIRSSNMVAAGFYENLGYTLDDVISMGKLLDQDLL